MSRRTWLAVIVFATLAATVIFSQFCWFKRNEHVALWLEGVALVFIFGLDYFNRLDEAAEQDKRHKESLSQLALLGEQAKAASEAARAAKRSADLTAALHRPYVAVSKVVLTGAGRYWNLNFDITNFGTLPAFNVDFSVKAFVDQEEQARNELHGPSSIQLFPSSKEAVTHQFDFGDPDGIRMREGQIRVRFDVQISYELGGGVRAGYSAEVAFRAAAQILEITRSSTTTPE
jgi:hypothetical protein